MRQGRDLSNRLARSEEDNTVDKGELENDERNTNGTGKGANDESVLDLEKTDHIVTGEGSQGHGETLPDTSNETLSGGSQTLRSHIRSDTSSRRNDQRRIDTLQTFQSQDEDVIEGVRSGILDGTGGDKGVTEHTNNTGGVSNDEDPVDTD